MTGHTKTYNEHWKEEGRPAAEEHFPPYDYFRDLFTVLDLEQITWIEKSRDMMVSWACVAYLTLHAMKVPYRGVLFQTQKDDKVIQLVDYSKPFIATRMPDCGPPTRWLSLWNASPTIRSTSPMAATSSAFQAEPTRFGPTTRGAT